MQPMFQFANSSVVTLNFTSDGLVGGAGFNGTIYDIDCCCNSGLLKITEENPYLELASPGFLAGAPTYCPNLNCTWIITFSTDYEVLSNISMLNLRSIDTQPDLLTMMDNFGRTLMQKNTMLYGDVHESITTSGQLSFHFITSPVTAFPPTLAAPGFLIGLTLVRMEEERIRCVEFEIDMIRRVCRNRTVIFIHVKHLVPDFHFRSSTDQLANLSQLTYSHF
ncbi:hypothetical protein GCK32_008349 [Trichostrongylus colubriformis]|uniref:CUB domain-containing protein n=1 Tax=Trichostrongylus colubriformis TaxID=6319 RepID=A0AAN8G5R0_TRICO